MAKFGFDERAQFFIEKTGYENLSGTPSDAQSGDMLVYIKSDHLFIKKPSVAEVLIVEDGVNLGADPGDPDGAQIFVQKNASAQLEFRTLRSTDGTVNFDDTTDSDFIDITVDLTDINDELDHGVLLGLGDDDHAQYLLLAGRSGGQIATGGTDSEDDLELQSNSSGDGEVKVIDGSDLRHGRRLMQEAAVQTTDATETTSDSFALSENRVYNVIVRVIARRSDVSGSQASWQFQTTALRESGGASFQGSVKQEYKSSNAGALDADLDIDTNDIRVRVTGIAAQTYEWCVYMDILESA